jgi:hypothetical protein
MAFRRNAFIATGALVLVASRAAFALGPPVLGWSNLDGSAPAPSSGGVFRLTGTAGQPDAVASTGGNYRLSGGYWVMPASGSVDAPAEPIPTEFALRAPSPNPFETETSVALALPQPSPVRVEVFGLAGERVRTLRDGTEPAGVRHFAWDGRDALGRAAPTGIYFVRVRAGVHSATQRLVKLH